MIGICGILMRLVRVDEVNKKKFNGAAGAFFFTIKELRELRFLRNGWWGAAALFFELLGTKWFREGLR
jgi:hypothetical protein